MRNEMRVILVYYSLLNFYHTYIVKNIQLLIIDKLANKIIHLTILESSQLHHFVRKI